MCVCLHACAQVTLCTWMLGDCVRSISSHRLWLSNVGQPSSRGPCGPDQTCLNPPPQARLDCASISPVSKCCFLSLGSTVHFLPFWSSSLQILHFLCLWKYKVLPQLLLLPDRLSVLPVIFPSVSLRPSLCSVHPKSPSS